MKSLLEKHWIYTVELCVFAFLTFMCNFKSINPTVFKKKQLKYYTYYFHLTLIGTVCNK